MTRSWDEYAQAAPVYDLATAWALDPLRQELAGLAARLTTGLGAGRVLDVCCGTGRQCLFLARAGLYPVGLDLSPAMLARASRLPLEGDRVPLVRADAARLPFADASFSLSTVALALHEKPPAARPAILAEMLRVTRPGGLVAVIDYLSPRSLAQAVSAYGVKAVERMAGREHHAHYAQFMASGALEGLLAGLGLKPYEIRRSWLGLLGLALLRCPE